MPIDFKPPWVFIMLWLPLAGITLNGALGFLALCFGC